MNRMMVDKLSIIVIEKLKAQTVKWSNSSKNLSYIQTL